ncbi:MAG: hypothetical protein ACK5NA_08500 [Enterococcus sp.]
MKKTATFLFLLLGIFVLTGCSHSTEDAEVNTNTVDSKPLEAEKDDLSDSMYTLNSREETDLVSASITFKDNTMEWTRTYDDSLGREEDELKQTVTLKDITVTTKDATYSIKGKQGNEEKIIEFTKVGNYRLSDGLGNLYSI